MAKKGAGKKVDLVPQILQGIRDDMRMLREDMNRGFADVRNEMHEGFAAVRGEMHEGFVAVNERLDGVIEIAGGHWRGHEERIKTLEQRVDRLER